MWCTVLLVVVVNVAATAAALPAAAAAAASASDRVVSYWYSVDNSYPAMLDMVSAHRTAFGTIIIDCGFQLDSAGNIPTASNATMQCNATIAGLAKLGVRTEVAVGLLQNSIDVFRAFSANPTRAAQQASALCAALSVAGISLDFEPQTPSGSPAGSPLDTPQFGKALAAVKQALNALTPTSARLTVCVADWSPVLKQYAELAPTVDRLLDMETYNDESWSTWYGYYKNMVNGNVDRSKVGIGVFPFASKNGTWPSTPQSVQQRMSQV